MGQVPTYVIIGDGRVARHMSHYFSLLQIPYLQWCRKQPLETLQSLIEQQQRFLLLIRDDAIEAFIHEHPSLKQKLVIHFSGSLVTELAIGVHPLMSFATDYYDLATYETIPFVIDNANDLFSDLMPGLPNQYYRIQPAQKALYHSLCVLSGNFTSLLWQKCFTRFANDLDLPSEVLFPYLDRIVANLKQNPSQALTGPLSRGDTKTINANLDALAGDAYQAIYQAFVNAYQTQTNTGDKK